jgi:DNA-binding MarR family transcriptional regulator
MALLCLAVGQLLYLNVKISPVEPVDHVDRVLEQWERVAPGVDRSPVAVIARLGRLVSYVDRALDANFSRFGINRAGWDVLASLRRAGAPYRLTPTELYRAHMRTSGAITNQLHRLEGAGLVRRLPDPHDGRSSLVELTDKGHELVRRAGPAHLETERQILAPLSPDEREMLARLLKKLLVSFDEAG